MLIKKGNRSLVTVDGSILLDLSYGDYYHYGGESPVGQYELNDKIIEAYAYIFKWYNQTKPYITSAYRSKAHNAKQARHSESSRHLYGEAIDFVLFSKDRAWGKGGLHQYYKNEIYSRGELYKALVKIGVTEFLFYDTFNHIATGTKLKLIDYSKIPADVKTPPVVFNNSPSLPLKKPVDSGPPTKEYYEYYHQDSSITTISVLLKDTFPIVESSSMTQKEFLNYKTSEGYSNLDKIWETYTAEQKYKFSSEYASLTQQQLAATTNAKRDEYVEKRKKVKLTYDASKDYEINVGTLLYIPKNKANIETIAATGKDLFMVQQNLQAFMDEEFQALTNDPTYIQAQDINIRGGAYSIRYLNLAVSVWIYIRSLDKIIDITPFIKSVDTDVNDGGGTFQISIIDIMSLDEVRKYAETYYSYIQKTSKDQFNTSFFKKITQQNDIVWIRFEKLEIEGTSDKRNATVDLTVDPLELPEKIYDMIGLVDNCSESYDPSSNDPIINISGRDLNKMIIEDGCYFIPLILQNHSEWFFLNYNSSNKVFKRLFTDGHFFSMFTATFRTIRDSLGFIFNQLTNVGILPEDSLLFNGYKNSYNRYTQKKEDRTSKAYEYAGANKKYLDAVERNGVWQIIKVIVDHQLDSRRLSNGELAMPEGSIIDLVRKMCTAPFVEFWGDTYGDQFVFMVRQPPFTKEQVQDYFNKNSFISISADMVGNFDVDWDDTYYTWYKIEVQDGLFGPSQFIAGTLMPVVYFEEYAQIFGMHKKVVTDPYINLGLLTGDKSKVNQDTFRNALANDLQYVIESNAILPFTRKGTITIVGGDRRIKKGMWILFEPTNEIFYVNSVRNSLNVSKDNIGRSTTLQVSRGMIKKYVIEETTIQINKKNIVVNYFDIINMKVIVDSLKARLTDGPPKSATTGVNAQLVNPDLFEFFIKRRQWEQ